MKKFVALLLAMALVLSLCAFAQAEEITLRVLAGQSTTDAGIEDMIDEALAKKYKFSLDTPYYKLPENVKNIILYGNGGEMLKVDTRNSLYPRSGDYYSDWEGVVPSVMRRWRESGSDEAKASYEKYMSIDICPVCNGARLNKNSLSVKVGGLNISELTDLSVKARAAVLNPNFCHGFKAQGQELGDRCSHLKRGQIKT